MANIEPTLTSDTFIFQDIPAHTPQEHVETSITDFSVRTCKLAILAYIKEFIDGRFKYVMRALATPFNTYTTDTIPATADQERRFLLLARKVAMLYQYLPAIMVVDSGTTMSQPGLGSYDKSEVRDGKIFLRQNRVLDVPLEVIVGAAREDTCDDLFDGVLTMFENRTLVGSMLAGTHWVVTLPLVYQHGARSTQPMPDDQTGSQVFAIRSLSFTPRFELWYYHTVNQLQSADLRGRGDQPKPKRSCDYPVRLRLNQLNSRIRAVNYPVGTRFLSDRPGVAVVTPDHRLVPIRLGTCRILAIGPHNEFTESYPLSIVL